MLTAEGDGPGSGSTGEYTLIGNPGTAQQTVQNVVLTDSHGTNVQGLDDVVFPGATSGTLYGYDSKTDSIYAFGVSGLNPADAIVAVGGLNGIGVVDPATGVVTPFITGADLPGDPSVGPGGLEFAPAVVPEPGAWMVLTVGVLALLGVARARRA